MTGVWHKVEFWVAVIAAVGLTIKEIIARLLSRPDRVHEVAKNIWQDAERYRAELRTEIDRLHLEVQALAARVQCLESQACARAPACEHWQPASARIIGKIEG
jgi:hypothetical protein